MSSKSSRAKRPSRSSTSVAPDTNSAVKSEVPSPPPSPAAKRRENKESSSSAPNPSPKFVKRSALNFDGFDYMEDILKNLDLSSGRSRRTREPAPPAITEFAESQSPPRKRARPESSKASSAAANKSSATEKDATKKVTLQASSSSSSSTAATSISVEKRAAPVRSKRTAPAASPASKMRAKSEEEAEPETKARKARGKQENETSQKDTGNTQKEKSTSRKEKQNVKAPASDNSQQAVSSVTSYTPTAPEPRRTTSRKSSAPAFPSSEDAETVTSSLFAERYPSALPRIPNNSKFIPVGEYRMFHSMWYRGTRFVEGQCCLVSVPEVKEKSKSKDARKKKRMDAHKPIVMVPDANDDNIEENNNGTIVAPTIYESVDRLFHPSHSSFTSFNGKYIAQIKAILQHTLTGRIAVTCQLFRRIGERQVVATDVKVTTNASRVRDHCFVLTPSELDTLTQTLTGTLSDTPTTSSSSSSVSSLSVLPPLSLVPIFTCSSRQIGRMTTQMPLLYFDSNYEACQSYIKELLRLKLFKPVLENIALGISQNSGEATTSSSSSSSPSSMSAPTPPTSDDADTDALNFLVSAEAALAPGMLPVAPGTPLLRRENEFSQLHGFLEGAVARGGASGTMFIAGMPGTGKTATVHQVIRKLQSQYEHGELPEHRVVEINATKLADPSAIYTLLWQSIEGETVSAAHAEARLTQYFSKGTVTRAKSPFLIVIVDELDYLVTKSQNVLYQLVEWPGYPGAKLVTVGISNTFDLPDRLLSRVQSRIGLTRLAFQPYNRHDLVAIVMARLHLSMDKTGEAGNTADGKSGDGGGSGSSTKVIVDDAIDLCARKVAASSGDARRVLAVCRRALQMAQDTGGNRVTVQLIEKAIADLYNTRVTAAVSSSSLNEQLFLAALWKCLPPAAAFALEAPPIGIKAIFDKMVQISRKFGFYRAPTLENAIEIALRWASCQVIEMQYMYSLEKSMVVLAVSRDDIRYSLRTHDVFGRLIEDDE